MRKVGDGDRGSSNTDAWGAWGDAPCTNFQVQHVRPGETVELLHMLAPPAPAPHVCESGSARPLPRYVEVNATDHLAVVATATRPDGITRTVGVGLLRPVDGGVAEMQLFVIPPLRHCGIGSGIFGELAELAQEHGVRRVRFCVTPAQSETIVGFLSRLSTLPTVWTEGERTIVEFPIAEGTVAALRQRGRNQSQS